MRNQLFLLVKSTVLLATKKAMVATKEATKESTIKKCPNWPGNKCSPIYCMKEN